MFCVNYGFYIAPHPQYYTLAPEAYGFQSQPGMIDPVPFKIEEVPHPESTATVEQARNSQAPAPSSAQDEQGERVLGLTVNDLRQFGEVRKKYWTPNQDEALMDLVEEEGLNWRRICQELPGRNENQCYGRYRRIVRQVKRGWAKEDDDLLRSYVDKFGMNWKLLSKYFENYSSKQIRERYLNHLRPGIQANDWTVEEDLQLCELINKHGRKWKLFEAHLTGRTENSIKNRYYGYLQRIQNKKTTETHNASRKRRPRRFAV